MEKEKRCPHCGRFDYRTKMIAEPGTMIPLDETELEILKKVDELQEEYKKGAERLDAIKDEARTHMENMWKRFCFRHNARNQDHEMQISGDGKSVEYKGITDQDYSDKSRQLLEEIHGIVTGAMKRQDEDLTEQELEEKQKEEEEKKKCMS